MYASEDEIFSEAELDSVLSGELDGDSPQFSQQVIFYRDEHDPDAMQFITTFSGLGLVKAELFDSDGLTVTTETLALTADSEFGDLIETIGRRIESVVVEPYPQVGDPEEGELTFDDIVDLEPTSSSSSSSSSSLAFLDDVLPVATSFALDGNGVQPFSLANATPAPRRASTTNLTTKIVKWMLLPVSMQFAYFKGLMDGLCDGFKSDVTGIADLGKMIAESFHGDYHRARAIVDSLKLLRQLTFAQLGEMLKVMVSAFISHAENNIPWTFDPGSIPDNVAVVYYCTGYAYGFVLEQLVVAFLGAGIVAKLGEAIKVVLGLVKVGQIVLNIAATIQKFIVAMMRFLTPTIVGEAAALLVREMTVAITEAANLVIGGGRKVGVIIYDAISPYITGGLLTFREIADTIKNGYLVMKPYLEKSYSLFTKNVLWGVATVIERVDFRLTLSGVRGGFELIISIFNYKGGNVFKYLIEYSTRGGVFDADFLVSILEIFDPKRAGYKLTRNPANPTQWISPGNRWAYNSITKAGEEEHRIIHLLHHMMEDSARLYQGKPTPHGAFRKLVGTSLQEMTLEEMLRFMDKIFDDWDILAKVPKPGGVPPAGTILNKAVKEEWIITFRDPIGTSNTLANLHSYTPTKKMLLIAWFDRRTSSKPISFVTAFPFH